MPAWSTHAHSADAFSVSSAERGRSKNVHAAEADVDVAAQNGAPLLGRHTNCANPQHSPVSGCPEFDVKGMVR